MEQKTLSRSVDPFELAALLEIEAGGNVRLIDVRTPGEYESVHVAGSYNVPLDTLGEHGREIGAVGGLTHVLVCQSGQRARRAEEVLEAAGLRNLHVLNGGINGWVASGFPVRRGPKRISVERQVRIAAGAIGAVGALLVLVTSPWFAVLPLFVGSGLVFAGVTDTCAMGRLLTKLPYNRPASCDVDGMVDALKRGVAPAPIDRMPGEGVAGNRTAGR